MTQLGQRLELTVTDLNVDGGAVARHEGRVVFLDRGLPGERLLARICGEKKRVLFGETLETLERSPDEVEPFCRYFGRCGGCSVQNYDYAAQLALKKKQVVQAFARIGGLEILPDGAPGTSQHAVASGTPDLAVMPGIDGESGPVGGPRIIASPKLREYRNKMEYAFGQGAEGLALGLRRRASHEVLDIERCPLQSEASGKVLGVVREWAVRHAFSAWQELQARSEASRRNDASRALDSSGGASSGGCLRYLVLREPEFRPAGRAQIVVELICGTVLPPKPAVEELWRQLSACGVTSFILSQRRARLGLARGERIFRVYGERTLWEDFGGLLLEFPASGFSQTNTGAAIVLYKEAAAFALGGLEPSSAFGVPHGGTSKGAGCPEGGSVPAGSGLPSATAVDVFAGHAGLPLFSEAWDLYSGVGALALSLGTGGDRVGKILGVELDGEAVRLARANAARLGAERCVFAAGDVASMVESLGWPASRPRLLPAGFSGPDLLVVDPPRSGMSARVLQGIKRARPRAVVYVSCDPATQARDIGQLGDMYRLAGLTLLDMFPHTLHVESVCLLVLRS